MAKKSVGFVDQHIEKVVLGVCGAAFLGVLVYFFALSPYGEDPGNLLAQAKDAADRAQQAWRSKQPPPPAEQASQDKDAEALVAWYGAKSEGLRRIADTPGESRQTQPFPPEMLEVLGTAEQDRHGLARFAAPGVPIVMSGTSSLEIPISKYDIRRLLNEGLPGGEPREVSWVTVCAQLPITEQLQNFYAAEYTPDKLALLIVDVQLQRKVVGDPGADWEDVETYQPYKALPRPEIKLLDPASSEAVGELTASISKIGSAGVAQDLIARTEMPFQASEDKGDRADFRPIPWHASAMALGDDDDPPSEKDIENAARKRARDWLSDAKKALKGTKPFRDPDPDAAYILASAAAGTKDAKLSDIEKARAFLKNDVGPALRRAGRPEPTREQLQNPGEPEKLMPLYAHDLTVVPGRTYVYRMRYEAFNVFAGDTDIMENEADARRLTLFGAWSPPSREVEVKTDIYFYLTRISDARRGEVWVTVFKVDGRGRVTKSIDTVRVGDVIGDKTAKDDFTTDMICVDIVAGGRNDATLVYVNQNDGSVWERTYSADRRDKRFISLNKR